VTGISGVRLEICVIMCGECVYERKKMYLEKKERALDLYPINPLFLSPGDKR